MRPIGTPAELERRRRLAVQRLAEGESAAIVARILGVNRTSLWRWQQAARRPGGLDSKPHPGPKPRLADAQLARLERLLLQGATAHGWDTDLWTAARVAEMIRRHFGVCFHAEHVRKLLKRRLGWTSQKPQKRAAERDEDESARWLADEIPKIIAETRRRGAHLVFLDESGFLLSPLVRRTLAPRGQTPVHRCRDRRDRISAISCITYSPVNLTPGLYFRLMPDNENVRAVDVVAFLEAVRRRLRHGLTVVWDGSNIHDKALVVRRWLAEHPEVVTHKFPAYTPELNPQEGVWGWTKYGRLANYAPDNVHRLRARVSEELEYLRTHPYELDAFVHHSNLPLLV
jgi:transposase